MSLLVTATFERSTGLPADRVSNTFAFRTDANPVDAALGHVACDLVYNFYDSVGQGQTTRLSQYLSPTIVRTAGLELRAYDITGKLGLVVVNGKKRPIPHGSPIYSEVYTLAGAAGGTALPGEVAAVLTLEAEDRNITPVEGLDGSTPIRPRARKTGRIYLGPLGSNALTATGTAEPRVHATFRSVCLTVGPELVNAGEASGLEWGVWSRESANIFEMGTMSMDDAFDTMRSRGTKATVRQRVTAD